MAEDDRRYVHAFGANAELGAGDIPEAALSAAQVLSVAPARPPTLGVATVADGRLPALTAFWESMSLPGIFFAGNVTQAERLEKHGVSASSTAVNGFRYNARVLAHQLARRFGIEIARPPIPAEGAVRFAC